MFVNLNRNALCVSLILNCFELVLRSQFASSNDELYCLRSQNVILKEGQKEFIYNEYFFIDNFKLSQFVIPSDYEPLTYTKRRKYFEPHLYNSWGKSDARLSSRYSLCSGNQNIETNS